MDENCWIAAKENFKIIFLSHAYKIHIMVKPYCGNWDLEALIETQMQTAAKNKNSIDPTSKLKCNCDHERVAEW